MSTTAVAPKPKSYTKVLTGAAIVALLVTVAVLAYLKFKPEEPDYYAYRSPGGYSYSPGVTYAPPPPAGPYYSDAEPTPPILPYPDFRADDAEYAPQPPAYVPPSNWTGYEPEMF